METSKNKLRKQIDKYFRPSAMLRTHYLKWELDKVNDWSIRYFWTFDNHKQYERKWVLKSHKTKDYVILSQSEALDFIKHMAETAEPIEITGIRIGKKYHKLVVRH